VKCLEKEKKGPGCASEALSESGFSENGGSSSSGKIIRNQVENEGCKANQTKVFMWLSLCDLRLKNA
jgi:hypothetical protein